MKIYHSSIRQLTYNCAIRDDVNGTTVILLFEQAVAAQVIGIPLPGAVTVFIGQAADVAVFIIAIGSMDTVLRNNPFYVL